MIRAKRKQCALALAGWMLSSCAAQTELEDGADAPAAEETQERVATTSQALDNGLARTPPMGWNSWNKLGCAGLNEAAVRGVADAMVSSGMQGAGYQYIVLDDCWQSSRDAQGKIVADAQKFPSGIKALADYVHNKGLKFGIYTDAGTHTCQGRPGSLNHEAQDAATYAAWGVDFVKVDWCNTDGLDPQTRYTVFRDAIASSGRSMVFSICNWGVNSPWLWGASTGHMWRTAADISDSWTSMLYNAVENNFPNAAKPGAWNDPDMLEVGNGGLSDAENRAHMSLWAVMAAPLIAGNDLRNMSAATRMTLTNPEVIAVDQDSAGVQGYPVRDYGNGLQVWSKRLATAGTRAVVLLNKSSVTQSITASWADLGLSGSASVRDLWARTNRGTFTGSYAALVPAHGAVMLKVSGANEVALQAPRINIKNTDTRPITNLRLEVSFYVGGFQHFDYEEISVFDKNITLELNGLNGTWDGTKLVGNFVTLKSAVAGEKLITIRKTDTRPIVDVRLKASFQVAGASHVDWENPGDFVGEQSLVLNASGGTQNGTTWGGDFLRRWGPQDEAAAPAELVWPSTTAPNNSHPSLRANHAALKRVEPRVLVLDVVRNPTATALDEFLPRMIDAFAEGSRHRAYANPNATPFVNYKIDKIVDLKDPVAEYPSFWPAATPAGWDVGKLFTQEFGDRLKYTHPSVPGRFLTMCEIFEKGLVNELWISADTSRNIYENQSYLQLYDANRQPIANSFTKCTNGCFHDPDNKVSCKVSVRMQEINRTRGEGCGTHAAGHAQERLRDTIPYMRDNATRFYGFDLDTRHGLNKTSLYECAYTTSATQPCVNRPAANRMVSNVWPGTAFDVTNWGAACGSVHFPPNARFHYDYGSAVPALTSCLGYGTGTGGTDVITSFDTARINTYEAVHGDCGGGWMMYMGQSMPGLGNQAKDSSGNAMLNWWPFLFY